MKRARWRESGGTAMGIITRFICNIPSPFPAVTTISLPSFGVSPYNLFSVLTQVRRKAESAKSSLLCVLAIFLCSTFSFFLFYFFLLNLLIHNLIKYQFAIEFC